MKTEIKRRIEASLLQMREENLAAIERLTDAVSLDVYAHLTRESEHGTIWTDALQTALRDHERVIIPPSDTVYFIDDTVVVPSHRHIEATGAILRLTPDCEVLMLRNAHTVDGTHAPISTDVRDENISIHGGRWEESQTKRGGYGKSGRYTHFGEDGNGGGRLFYGVSTCLFFNNLSGLTLTDMTFAHTAGFAVQTGDLTNGVFENITFDACYADGLHLNGNSENLLIRQVRGEVGDDLVALNMYDWQNSSVDFGPTRNVLCDGLDLFPSSRYKALRIEPGIYTYDDGSTLDCGLFDAIIRHVTGIATFKMYFQTPCYRIGTEPERGGVGSSDNLFFEHIHVDLTGPIDKLGEYVESHPVKGTFAAFELGSHIGYVSFEHIDFTYYPEKFPMSCLVCVGPKSVRVGDTEVFDPYLTSHVGTVVLSDIRVNGHVRQKTNAENEPLEWEKLVREIAFDDINGDGHSTGCGTIQEVIWKD